MKTDYELSLENADIDRWKEYDIFQAPIFWNGESTKLSGIIQNGQLKHVVSDKYVLLPNEEAEKIARQSAKLVGLEHLKTSYTKSKARMHVFYVPPKTYEVDGDQVKVGVDVRNGIDGRISFGCGLFTYRSTCSNGVIYGYKAVKSIREVHVGKFDAVIKDLANQMVLVMDQSLFVIETYRDMARTKATAQLIKQIKATGLTKKVLKAAGLTNEITEAGDLTEWNIYNDVTQEIWHSETALSSKINQYMELHKVLPLIRK